MSTVRGALLGLLVLFAGLLPACATVPTSAGFPEVEREALARGEPAPGWARDDSGRAGRDRRVAECLEGGLTMDEAVAVALVNNAELQAGFETLGLAQAEVVAAGLPDNPVLFGQARFPDTAPLGTNFEFEIAQSLLSILLIPARTSLAETEFEQARFAAVAEVMDLAWQTRAAYVRVLVAERQAAVRGLAAEAAGASLALTGRLHAAGNVSALTFESERSHAESVGLDLAASRMELATAREALTRLLGLWGASAAWTTAEELSPLPPAEPDLSGIEALAVARRPDLAAAMKAADLAAKALEVSIDWRFLASVEVGLDAEKEPDGQWLVGPNLSVELPLFSQRQPEIAAAQSRLRAALSRARGLAVTARSEARELRDRLLIARRVAERYRDVILPSQERLVAEWQRHYNFMLADYDQLLAAKAAEYDAYQGYLAALGDYWTLSAELRRAAGGRLPDPEPPAELAAPQPPAPPAMDHGAGHDHSGRHPQ